MKDKEVTCFFENKWGTYSATYFSSSADTANAIHPTIVFVHGFRAKKEWYSWIGECLASQGYSSLLFTVPSPKLPNPHQWSDGIKNAIDYLSNKESPLHDKTCSERIGVMGHSMGGLGALMAGSEDSRIKCVVGLAPAIIPRLLTVPEEIYNMSIPIQLQIGSEDGIISPEDVKAFFNNLASEKKTNIEIKGGNHIRFMDRTTASTIGEYVTRFGALGKQFKDGKASITFDEQHNISSSNFVEWFDHFLKH